MRRTPTFLLLLAVLGLQARAGQLDLIQDGPRPNLRASADRAWLLDRDAELPVPVWPRPRADWLNSSPSPSLLWYRSAMPMALKTCLAGGVRNQAIAESDCSASEQRKARQPCA